MMIDKPLIFRWRQPGERHAHRSGVVLMGFLAVGIIFVFDQLIPAEVWARFDWTVVWQKLLARPYEFAKFILASLGAIVMLGGLAAHKKRARLILEPDTLRYSCGLPLLGRWLDWTLDLEAVRANRLPLQLAGVAMGSQPVNNYTLSWRKVPAKRLRLAAWHLPNQVPVALQKPTSSFGLVRWQTPENQALLQQQFHQLPLVQALRQRGIELPSVNGKRQLVGIDLMAYPRMKFAVISFFICILSVFVLFHLMRHHHYFSPPALLVWVAFGIAAGLGMLAWLWSENPGKVNTITAAAAIGFRSTQVLLAALFAIAAGLLAPSLPLAFSSTVHVPQEIAFELKKAPLRLQASAAYGVPDVQPNQALDFWTSQPEGAAFSLPVRQGVAGLWWQFDSRVLEGRLDAFYGFKTRH